MTLVIVRGSSAKVKRGWEVMEAACA
jgi:hypothetical protein